MINSSDKIKEFPGQFNKLEEIVKSLEERVAELEQVEQKGEEISEK